MLRKDWVHLHTLDDTWMRNQSQRGTRRLQRSQEEILEAWVVMKLITHTNAPNAIKNLERKISSICMFLPMEIRKPLCVKPVRKLSSSRIPCGGIGSYIFLIRCTTVTSVTKHLSQNRVWAFIDGYMPIKSNSNATIVTKSFSSLVLYTVIEKSTRLKNARVTQGKMQAKLRTHTYLSLLIMTLWVGSFSMTAELDSSIQESGLRIYYICNVNG